MHRFDGIAGIGWICGCVQICSKLRPLSKLSVLTFKNRRTFQKSDVQKQKVFDYLLSIGGQKHKENETFSKSVQNISRKAMFFHGNVQFSLHFRAFFIEMLHFHCTIVLFASKCFIFIALPCFFASPGPACAPGPCMAHGPLGPRSRVHGPGLMVPMVPGTRSRAHGPGPMVPGP